MPSAPNSICSTHSIGSDRRDLVVAPTRADVASDDHQAHRTRVTFSVSILRCSADGSGLATCTNDPPTAMTASRPSTNPPGPAHEALDSTRSFDVKPLAAAE